MAEAHKTLKSLTSGSTQQKDVGLHVCVPRASRKPPVSLFALIVFRSLSPLLCLGGGAGASPPRHSTPQALLAADSSKINAQGWRWSGVSRCGAAAAAEVRPYL